MPNSRPRDPDCPETAEATPRFAAVSPNRAPISLRLRTALFSHNGADRDRALRFLVEQDKQDVIPAFIAVLRLLAPNRPARCSTSSNTSPEPRSRAMGRHGSSGRRSTTNSVPTGGSTPSRQKSSPRSTLISEASSTRGYGTRFAWEEIVWGGVKTDGIPALVNAEQIPAAGATYLTDRELVFGVSINGGSRAYPLRILDWRKMFNDVVGGVPVSLAYCTLCGSGILFDTRVRGRCKPFVFGSSGLLYRSNKLMYDTQTNSLWNQFTGRPVVGKLTGSKIELKILPVVITNWQDWLGAHSYTTVLSLDTGLERDYQPGRPYGACFASPDLMFPVVIRDRRLAPEDRIFVLRDGDNEIVWALSLFRGGAVIHDRAGARDVVLIGYAETEKVRAYESGGRTFVATEEHPSRLASEGALWTVTEGALTGPGGESVARLPGHVAYWLVQYRKHAITEPRRSVPVAYQGVAAFRAVTEPAVMPVGYWS